MACDHAHTCCSLPLLRLEVSPRRAACCRLHPGRPCFSARPQGCAVLLQAAARAPSIVFLDELDGLVPARSAGSDPSAQIYASVVSTLLALMDGVSDRGDVIVVGATNRC